MKTMKNIEEVFPIHKVEEDCLINRRGEVTVAYALELPEIFTLSNEEYESFHHTWIKALKALPQHSIFHKQDWYFQKGHTVDYQQGARSFLTHSSDRYFHERPFLDHQCYVMLTQRTAGRAGRSVASSLISGKMIPKNLITGELLQNFLDSAGQFERILNDSGLVTARRLSADALTGTSERPGLLERYCFLLHPEERSVIKDTSFKEGVKIGDQRLQLYTLSDAVSLPALCGSRINYDPYSTDKTKFSIGFASPLGQLLSCNHIYNQYVFIEDAARTIKQLESKRLRLQSLSAYSRENSLSSSAVNDFLDEAIGDQRQPVQAHYNLMAWTDNPETMKELRTQVSSALAQVDVTAKLESDGAPQIYWSGLPGNAGDLPAYERFDTFMEQASCFFNLESGYRSSISPVGLRLGDRLTGKPVHVDISDEPVKQGVCTNRNKFILGPSGSGKSFFTNHMVRSYYEQGSHVVLVDVGHSYQGLCQLVGGYYFTYSEEQPLCFNPFYLNAGEVLDTEKKESIKTLLLALWKKDDETFNRSEYVALSISLQLYFQYLQEDATVFPCFNTYYEFLKTRFIAILKADKVKEKDFDVENFLYVLRPYYRGGEFDYLLNASDHLNLLEQRFIVFELDNIKDHPILFPVVTIIIMEVFIAKMRKLKGIRKMILIEEAWKAIAREGMAEYIKYLFKTVRKFYGEAVVVTQEVEDIISSPIVKQAIINNSDCKILLDQSKYQNKFDAIQELLGLSEKEKALVLSINQSNDPDRKYKEVFISLGGVISKVYATEVSQEEYLAYTTEQSEKLQVQEYTETCGGDMRRGIALMAQEMRENLKTA
ncbi:TraG family conjugative transposon ATPase [Fulvivirga maritima]|uniref:TraG family conjugative transposon ATPase n=1 Tax=Fulvivirga maritima TaxID=2904247 RepID=UPI001F407284|nr:TraG family conjugative transposon ATPase [Fulvivirga maritima]UII29082.1 TraG family conjugative transposon ATPase [Fulvivirga maritima]